MFCVVAPFSELSLKHELSHEIATNLWGPAEHWLEEGLANFVVDNKSSLMKRQCLGMMQSKQWIPLKKTGQPRVGIFQLLSRRRLSRVGRLRGVPIRDLWRRPPAEESGRTAARSIRKVYGKRLSKLESEYRSDLLKHRPEVHDAINLPGRGDDNLLP